jgi:hypothetical protein
MRLLAQRLQLQLAARQLAAHRGQACFVLRGEPARGLDLRGQAVDRVAQVPLLTNQDIEPLTGRQLLDGDAVDSPRQILTALNGAGPLGLPPCHARARRRDLSLRRLQLAPRLGQRGPPLLLHARLRLVLALARVGRGVDLGQPVRDLFDVGGLHRGLGAQLGDLRAARFDPARQLDGLRVVVIGALHAELRLVRQRVELVLRRRQLRRLLAHRQPLGVGRGLSRLQRGALRLVAPRTSASSAPSDFSSARCPR